MAQYWDDSHGGKDILEGPEPTAVGIKTFLIYPGTLIQNALCLVKQLTPRLGKLIDMSFAPLRRIVSRTLEVFEVRPKYFIYSLLDSLECGHEQSVQLFGGLSDLLNAYTENPDMRSRRHRCHECAAVVAQKKPVASVGLAKVEVA